MDSSTFTCMLWSPSQTIMIDYSWSEATLQIWTIGLQILDASMLLLLMAKSGQGNHCAPTTQCFNIKILFCALPISKGTIWSARWVCGSSRTSELKETSDFCIELFLCDALRFFFQKGHVCRQVIAVAFWCTDSWFHLLLSDGSS